MPKRTNISSILIIGAVFLGGCAAKSSMDQSALDELAVSCNLPKGTLLKRPDNSVQMQPKPDANYEDVDCLLRKVKAAGFSDKLGFVGNETYSKEAQK